MDHAEYMRKYMAEHPEQRAKAIERVRLWRLRNPERHRQYQRISAARKRKPRKSEEDRFWGKVDKTDTCWVWTAAIGVRGAGYGAFWTSSKVMRAHRWAYEHLVGPVPEGQELAHACHNSKCVRPDPEHVRPLTHLENIRETPKE